MSIGILIADDDAGMRLVLRKAIEKAGEFTVIGEAADGEAALQLYEKLRPEVVFLDVQMPALSGIECAKRIADVNPQTVIIFATAFEIYMPEAFEVYAFDYLTKPFKIERLNHTLNRIRNISAIRRQAAEFSPANRSKAPKKLVIHNRDGITLIDMEDIILIQREERSTVIYTAGDRFVTSESLGDLEEKLEDNLFFRSHKSYIVNLGAISKIYPYGRWTYIIKLKGTARDALLTKDKFDDLNKVFK